MTAEPDLAVIVIGCRAPASIVDSVRSLIDQGVPLEIVVVNSGGGDAKSLLSDAGVELPVIEIARQVFVGAARNIGIAATRAPFVAFLADDCLACPGWAEARIRRHVAGAPTVSSAISNSHPRNPFACAAYLALFARRLPGLPAELALRYGVSFDRRLFEEYGLFDESMRVAEDTEFLKRLPPELEPVWEPEVRTIHRNETRLRGLLIDQYRRGYRSGAYYTGTTRAKPFRLARNNFKDRRQIRKLAGIGLSGPELTFVARSMPIVVLALFAKSLGIYFGARGRLKNDRAAQG
ncbi:glycosyltransferase family 2 protein [Mesorhizobium qingshengii]|uniref:Glycosyltransferase involved in cell wall bisynthesis n=1 Tax=Mesorhizobium qingshengii TaxID=1165689 RepID=A0A1G5XHX1_9HYPH|nr:glycosyltransferase [Mesorhizobium qingshengii]SDA70048.1 Glycosyltransferase involved in cell wall bisynthesis [Mesorhizobium qingshengii]